MTLFLHFSFLHSLLGSSEGKYLKCLEATAVLDWFCRYICCMYVQGWFPHVEAIRLVSLMLFFGPSICLVIALSPVSCAPYLSSLPLFHFPLC